MHPAAYEHMKRMVEAHVRPRFTSGCVLDVGSRRTDLKDKTHRTLFPLWDYFGLDVRPGDNVDVVVGELDKDWPRWPRQIHSFDVVISGQTLEHCRKPWELVSRMAFMLIPNGILLLTAPFMWHLHNHPGDYYRFTGDGLAELCKLAGLTVLESGIRSIKKKKCHADAWCAACKQEVK